MQTKQRNWKEFTVPAPVLRKDIYYASINAAGKITLNRKAWEALERPKYVSLLLDEDGLTIGVRPSTRVMPNSYGIVTRPDRLRSTNYWIHAKPFLASAKIDIAYSIRFLDPHIEDDTLILDLNHTTRVLGPRSKH